MTITGQLELGAAQVVQRDTREVIGYVYTVESGKGQLQRWLLHKHPMNAFDVEPPPPEMKGMSLADWQAGVPNLWKPGSFYVRAQTDMYYHGDGSNGTWTQIPSELPKPTFPQVPGASYQLDYGRFHVLAVAQEHLRGLAYSVGSLSDPANAEYWMLPAEYKPAGATASIKVAEGAEKANTLAEFVAFANQSFRPGCAFAITGCVNYTGPAVPSTL